MKKPLWAIITTVFLLSGLYLISLSTQNHSKEKHTNTVLYDKTVNKINTSKIKKNKLGNLQWYDEFEGNELNKQFWNFQTGGGGWGNNEMQYYTDQQSNCYLKDGKLYIRALKEAGRNNHYTSARLTTKGKVYFLYGRIDIKAKLPKGKGLLPAFWLLPSEDSHQNRKKNGELDIMEMLGDKPRLIYGVAHYSINKKYKSFGKFHFRNGDASEDAHVYSLEWSPDKLKWLVDNKAYYTFNIKENFGDTYNPYSKKFYLILNIAIGGNWPGNILYDSDFPALLEIDYIKYSRKIK